MVPESLHDFFVASASVAGALIGLLGSFVVLLVAGFASLAAPDRTGWMRVIAVLVVVDFSIGIARAWELIGGPSIGFGREVGAILRQHDDDPADGGAPRGG